MKKRNDWFDFLLYEGISGQIAGDMYRHKTRSNIKSFKIASAEINCEDNFTLLCVNIDYLLTIDDHVSDICKKASRPLAILKRNSNVFNKAGQNDSVELFYAL